MFHEFREGVVMTHANCAEGEMWSEDPTPPYCGLGKPAGEFLPALRRRGEPPL